jgi:hypothetical protein
VGKRGADLFNAPDRAAFVKLSFFPDERRMSPAKKISMTTPRTLDTIPLEGF